MPPLVLHLSKRWRACPGEVTQSVSFASMRLMGQSDQLMSGIARTPSSGHNLGRASFRTDFRAFSGPLRTILRTILACFCGASQHHRGGGERGLGCHAQVPETPRPLSASERCGGGPALAGPESCASLLPALWCGVNDSVTCRRAMGPHASPKRLSRSLNMRAITHCEMHRTCRCLLGGLAVFVLRCVLPFWAFL